MVLDCVDYQCLLSSLLSNISISIPILKALMSKTIMFHEVYPHVGKGSDQVGAHLQVPITTSHFGT